MELDLDKFQHFKSFSCIDAHTEGEPLRIITAGYPEIKGDSMLAKRRYLQRHLDQYRTLLMHEPRGHADMYGVIMTPPVCDGSDFGVLFLHNEGYSSMCGHGIIATCKVAVEVGEIAPTCFPHNIKIDSPAGLISAWVDKNEHGEITTWFDNVPSFAHSLGRCVNVQGFGEITYDIGFGGAYYAYVNADEIDVSCRADNVDQLISLGRKIKQAVMESVTIEHPHSPDLGFLYGTIFYSSDTTEVASHSRHVCIFADGEVDRSPTGTGVSGRIALLHAKQEISIGQQITIESIVDGKMQVMAQPSPTFFQYDAVTPQVTGRAWITGVHQFLLDPTDIFQQGFILR